MYKGLAGALPRKSADRRPACGSCSSDRSHSASYAARFCESCRVWLFADQRGPVEHHANRLDGRIVHEPIDEERLSVGGEVVVRLPVAAARVAEKPSGRKERTRPARSSWPARRRTSSRHERVVQIEVDQFAPPGPQRGARPPSVDTRRLASGSSIGATYTSALPDSDDTNATHRLSGETRASCSMAVRGEEGPGRARGDERQQPDVADRRAIGVVVNEVAAVRRRIHRLLDAVQGQANLWPAPSVSAFLIDVGRTVGASHPVEQQITAGRPDRPGGAAGIRGEPRRDA